jgi:two-component system LytT family response regulator
MSSALLLTDDDRHARQRVTAFLEQALDALDVRALNELLKPFSKHGFEELIARLGASRPAHMQLATLELTKYARFARPSKIAFKTNKRIVIVPTEKIEWISAERDYVHLHVAEEDYMVRATMSRVETNLPEQFVRIHRSTIVNLDYVFELRPLFSGEYSVTLTSGVKLTLSRAHRERLATIVPHLGFQ